MRKIFYYVLFLFPLLLNSQAKNNDKKVLMVVSSYGKDLGATRPGYEFDEFSQAYLIFKNNGLTIDIASPKGGNVEADKFNREKEYNKAVLEDTKALSLLNNTKATANINAENYNAIYIVGGKGAMFDLPYDPSLQDIILNLYNRKETVISSVCHGPASFVNIKNKDEFIIKDVEITGFCNIEEELFGKKWVQEFPFSLESKLKSRGAIFKQTDFMLSKIAVSGKFITGQNPFSTTRSAEAVVKSLGLTPVKRTLYKDEKSVYLIQDLLNKKKSFVWAEKELLNNKSSYDIQIIAVYGYYKILAAKNNREELATGIELVELTTPHFFNEHLQFLIAKTYNTLGKKEKAIEVLNELISKNLIKEEAQKLLQNINNSSN
ncbi:DJ-1/PfpI family protein [Tenacibaculum singaporense]|uniref:Type 1 glutamine amidotransferase domain-containing protein n=1 Tax=Tenacibaculum singaporense TaxID=2358479 RepID=A0A3S8R6J6_9FLAO|nr:DJ-1/PfpI family protein [Tenacibaculum singaporense]AZJ35383.1 type 1 glutamine amidotransferase domain-containing protein [Tenacibaculum singaporense]